MLIFVDTPKGTEPVLDGECDDITQIMPSARQALMIEKCKDPFWVAPAEADEELLAERHCIFPPSDGRPPLVLIPTPMPGRMERVTERPCSKIST